MVLDVKTIVISGYYGFGNSGDEAVLHSILLALRQEAEKLQMAIDPIVLSIDPKATERMHNVKAVHRLRLMKIIEVIRQSDGLISGGGSLLQDTTGLRTIPYYLGVIKLAQLLGKPTFIYSQGMGPIRHKSYYPLIRHIFNRSSYISVRDEESVHLIEKIGVRSKEIDIVSDPVMGIPLQQDEAGKNANANGVTDTAVLDERPSGVTQSDPAKLPVIGISVRLWHPQRKDLEQITEAIRILSSRRKVHFRFLPFYPPDDITASNYIIDRLGADYADRVSIAADNAYPIDMLEQVSTCDLIIGMRLHSLIYAASYLIPMIGISYDPKIDHFLQRMDMQAAGSSEQINPGEIAAEALQLLDHRDSWVQSKQHLIEVMKNKSQQPAQQICKYLRLKE